MNKEICENYLRGFNQLSGLNLKLSGRNGYYFIDAIVSDTGASINIFGGASLKDCKDFAVAILGLWNLIERKKK